MDALLELLKTNARLSVEELAVMLGEREDEVTRRISKYESDGVIKGYAAILDDSALDPDYVAALIELKVTPQSQSGFDDIARQIAEYEEVESVRLMSGGYDIIVSVTGKDIRTVSRFVAEKLAAIDAITSTATHFELKSYKKNGVMICEEQADERGILFP